MTLLAESGLTHRRPDYGFRSTRMGNDVVAVTEEVRLRTPFGTLLRFRKDTDVVQPRVLVVAPMSGHFATLLRGTVAVLLPDHDVYITDWKNARDMPLSDGHVRVRRICRSPDPLPGGDGRGQPHDRGVPARGRRAGRRPR